MLVCFLWRCVPVGQQCVRLLLNSYYKGIGKCFQRYSLYFNYGRDPVILLWSLPQVQLLVRMILITASNKGRYFISGLSFFFAESFVNKESMCNFAAQFNREIFKPLTFN